MTPSLDLPDSLPEPPWPLAALWAVAGFLALGFASLWLPVTQRDLFLTGLITVVFGLAAWAALRRSGREPGARRGWRLFGMAMAAQVGAQVWALGFLVGRGRPPSFPSEGEIFSFLSLGLVISALLAWPLTPITGSERLRKGLDGLGIALTAFFVAWVLALGPLFRAVPTTTLHRSVLVGFFLANATILGIGTFLVARQPERFHGPLGWLIFAFVTSALQATLQVPLSLTGGYYLGHPLDLLVLLAGLGVLLTALAPQPIQPGPAPTEEVRDGSLLALVLPLVPATLAIPFGLGVLLLAPERLDATFVVTGGLLTSLGLLRGLLALRDLQHLSSALEARVQDRTRSLRDAQELLLRTERLNGVAILGAGLAHDFKNLLGVIRLRSDLLADRLEHNGDARADLVGLREATARAEALAADLLTFGRNEEGAPQAVDLTLRLQQLHPLLRATLPPSIRLEMAFPAIPALVRCHPGSLDQIVVNLVLNARDAMPDGGLLRLTVTRPTPGSPVALAVSDTGPGIPESIQSRIFEPFFTTKRIGLGTGLGLASVHQTVRQLGGSITLASGPDLGTTFTLLFPVST